MPYRAPDAANPRVQRTRDRILAAARKLLAESGPAGLTYSVLAERAGVTRQTLYRHWPNRDALLVDLILVGPDNGYPEPGADPGAVAVAWLTNLRDALRDPARRAAVLGVTAQADADADSARAMVELTADRLGALNELLKPSGVEVEPEEYALVYGPVLARLIFERGEATDDFIRTVVARWLAGRRHQAGSAQA